MQSTFNKPNILEVSNLSISRGEIVLFEGLSFDLKAGDIIWVAGSNGIGKTSLLKCISGLLRPDVGNITFMGKDVHKNIVANTGYLGHNDGHKPNLTVLENLCFWHTIFKSSISPKQALKKVELIAQTDLRAKVLSAGQSRRLSLARILIKQAYVWVLDEPAAAMDVNGRRLIHALVAEHVASGGCALIASHTSPEKIGSNTRVLTLNGADNGAVYE